MPRGSAPSKVDQNQPEIVAALRDHGYCVIDLHALGGGIPDLMVISKEDTDRVMLMEVKMPGCKLNADEVKWHAKYHGRVMIVRSAEDALEVMRMFDFYVEVEE